MAATATLITLSGQPFPYIGIGVPAAQLITPIPSAELVFQSILGTITVAAAGETQSLLVNCPLPRSFCYVLVELMMRIEGADAAAWRTQTLATLQDSASVPSTLLPLELLAVHPPTGAASRTYAMPVAPSKLIVPLDIDNGLLSVFVDNPNIDDAAATLMFFARFLRYDRNQAQYWQVNTPVLIR